MGIGKAEKSILLQYSLYCSSLEPNLQFKVCLYWENLMVKRKGKDKNTRFQISNSRAHNFKELL